MKRILTATTLAAVLAAASAGTGPVVWFDMDTLAAFDDGLPADGALACGWRVVRR